MRLHCVLNYMNFCTIAWLTATSHHPIYAQAATHRLRKIKCVVEGEMAVISNPTHSNDSFNQTGFTVPTHVGQLGRGYPHIFQSQAACILIRWVNKLLAKPGLASINLLCPLKLPQSHWVAKATRRRKGKNSLQGFMSVAVKASVVGERSRVTTYLLKPKRMQTLV